MSLIAEKNLKIMVKQINIFRNALLTSFFVLMAMYLVCIYSSLGSLPRLPFLLFSIVISLCYLLLYRSNSLFCFESFFLFIYILSTFFNEIVIENLPDSSVVSAAFFNTSFSSNIENKGLLLDTICLVSFLLSSVNVNEKPLNGLTRNGFLINRNLTPSIYILSLFIGVYILYLWRSGVISTWFQYVQDIANYSNTEIVFLTMMFLALTSLEFSRLSGVKCRSMSDFFKEVNKLYLFEILFISFLLLISGNRNECLLIILPMLICYHIFIKPFDNKQFIIVLIVGVVLMAAIGLTRQTGSFSSLDKDAISIYEVTRDFASVDNNTKYLIDYTDRSSPVGIKNAMLCLFSSVPFLGGLITSVTGLENDTRTTELTTQGMQVSSNMDSGLGTSLLGDLYYTGGGIFAISFMYLFGFLIAILYRRFTLEKKYSIWYLVVYLFMFSNVIYVLRAEWTMPFRYIGFSFVIIIALRIFQPIKKY